MEFESEEYEKNTILWRLMRERKWEAFAARLRTEEGKLEARQKNTSDGRRLFLSHEFEFLECAPFYCIHALGEAYPECWGITLKHRIHFFNSEVDEIDDETEEADDDTNERNYYIEIRRPLHRSILIDKPRDPTLVYHVYQLAPSMIHERDEQGQLPLHIACSEGNNTAIEILLSLNPEAAREKDNCGQLPLHNLGQRDEIHPCFHHVLETYPMAAVIGDERGKTPLHEILDWDPPEDEDHDFGPRREAVALLLRYYPYGIKKEERHSRELPIHIAARNFNRCPELIKLLREQYPESIHRRNAKGQLPVSIMMDSLSPFSSSESFLLLLPNKDALEPSEREREFNKLLHTWLRECPILYDSDHSKSVIGRWEEIIQKKLIKPNGNSLTTSDIRGCAGLSIPCTSFYFEFPALFRYMAQTNPEQLFLPQYVRDSRFLSYEDGLIEIREARNTDGDDDIWMNEGSDRIEDRRFITIKDDMIIFEVEVGEEEHAEADTDDTSESRPFRRVTPLARIWRELGSPPFSNNTEKDVIVTLQMVFHQLHRDTGVLHHTKLQKDKLTGNDTNLDRSNLMSTTEEGDQSIPLIHLACFFSSAICPSDFGIVLDSFLHNGTYLHQERTSMFWSREQCLQLQDDLGNLPLHYVCSSYESPKCDDVLLEKSNKRLLERKSISEGIPLQQGAYRSCLRMFCAVVLKHAEEGSLVKMVQTKNRRGELPLHVALKRKNRSCCNKNNRWIGHACDGQYLWSLYPASATIRDPSCFNLYPFMLAAVDKGHKGKKCSSCRIDTTYFFLQRYVSERGFEWTTGLDQSTAHLSKDHRNERLTSEAVLSICLETETGRKKRKCEVLDVP